MMDKQEEEQTETSAVESEGVKSKFEEAEAELDQCNNFLEERTKDDVAQRVPAESKSKLEDDNMEIEVIHL